ncbi:MAG: hypothetical protein KJ002_08355, partial [Candidatus Dadabacteria bacterium]|nr:hypothetical protein [Candidatus Dadabacteria bacterium]
EGPASVGVIGGAGKKGISPGSKEAQLSVEIPDGGERTVYFTVDTEDATGAIAMEVKASGNDESTSSNLDVPVLADLPAKREESIGRIES